MAFPQVLNRSASAISTLETDHAFSLPATVLVNELLLFNVHFTMNSSTTITTPSGWTLVYNLNGITGSNTRTLLFKRKADGTEGGTTVNFVTNVARSGCAQSYRIGGWGGNLTSDVVTATDTSGADNSPTLVSGFGAVDTLWIIVCSSSGTSTITPPAAYSANNLFTNYDGGTLQFEGRMCSSHREVNAASETPGNYSGGPTGSWNKATIAVAPGSSGLPVLDFEMTMAGGAIAGGDETGFVFFPFVMTMSGGAIAGGTASVPVEFQMTMAGGAIAGGPTLAALIEEMSGGAIAGGEATVVKPPNANALLSFVMTLAGTFEAELPSGLLQLAMTLSAQVGATSLSNDEQGHRAPVNPYEVEH